MYDQVITLLTEAKKTDEFGDISVEREARTVFAELRSIGQAEFYQASAVGLKPEVKFVIADYLDYNNEKTLEFTPFNGKAERYTVLRTYRNGTRLEITCTREVNPNEHP